MGRSNDERLFVSRSEAEVAVLRVRVRQDPGDTEVRGRERSLCEIRVDKVQRRQGIQ